jgi:hypothetical protein
MRSRPHSCAAFAREWARKPEGWKARESNVNPSGRHPSCLTNRICLIRNRNPQNYGTDSAIIRPQIYLIILPRILVTFRSAAQPIHECDPSVLRRWTDSHSSGARQQHTIGASTKNMGSLRKNQNHLIIVPLRARFPHRFQHPPTILAAHVIVRNKPHLLVIDSRRQNFFFA